MSVNFEVLEVLEALARFPGITELLTYDGTPKTNLYAPDVTWFISFELDRNGIGRETFRWIQGVVGLNQRHHGLRVELLAKLLDQRTALITLRGFSNSLTSDLAEAFRGANRLMGEHIRWN